ncbi:MAG: orotate phosphoribosyltransferase [Bifidobacteriaceae bacterium]|nr:orotate phosphoribosyltransferase [Bifidobacteriaceae bacterium]
MSDITIDFTKFLLESKVLQFGDFTLKSGRKSPYFINAGAFNDGVKIAKLADFYAQMIVEKINKQVISEDIDTIFGPAYKGIPLAVSISSALSQYLNRPIGYTFDRKEAKDHGDGGLFVGTQLRDGMNVLMVDDVMTAGTAVREVVPKLYTAAAVNILGLALSVDRMEKTAQSNISAVQAVEQEYHFPVFAIANVEEIFTVASHVHNDENKPYCDEAIQRKAFDYLAQYKAE